MSSGKKGGALRRDQMRSLLLASPISTDTRSILGPWLKWVSSCGRFRHRPTIGCRERHSRGFARLPWSVFWSRSGTLVPVSWKLAFSDHIGLVRTFGITDPSEVGD